MPEERDVVGQWIDPPIRTNNEKIIYGLTLDISEASGEINKAIERISQFLDRTTGVGLEVDVDKQAGEQIGDGSLAAMSAQISLVRNQSLYLNSAVERLEVIG